YSDDFIWNLSALLVCSILCSAQNVTRSNDSHEAIKVKAMMQASSPATSSTSTTDMPKARPTAKTIIQAQEVEEEEYNFLSDRLPALSEDEYSNLGEDANPLHFLKQQPLLLETDTQPQPPQSQEKPHPDSPVALPQSGGSPIYITIPIYISTAGRLPLTLTIGDQEMSLNKFGKNNNRAGSKKNPSTKAPNSHFNRLLQEIESPKRRTTNRHRSQLKSRIYAVKDRKDRKDAAYQPRQ
ncbi:hypothetical protein KR009_000587, partial [Drosophila setifemur]